MFAIWLYSNQSVQLRRLPITMTVYLCFMVRKSAFLMFAVSLYSNQPTKLCSLAIVLTDYIESTE